MTNPHRAEDLALKKFVTVPVEQKPNYMFFMCFIFPGWGYRGKTGAKGEKTGDSENCR